MVLHAIVIPFTSEYRFVLNKHVNLKQITETYFTLIFILSFVILEILKEEKFLPMFSWEGDAKILKMSTL